MFRYRILVLYNSDWEKKHIFEYAKKNGCFVKSVEFLYTPKYDAYFVFAKTEQNADDWLPFQITLVD